MLQSILDNKMARVSNLKNFLMANDTEAVQNSDLISGRRKSAGKPRQQWPPY